MLQLQVQDGDLESKEAILRQAIAQVGSAVVAFSGGADSALIVFIVHQVLGSRMAAATIDSALLSRRDLRDAIDMCSQLGIRHRIIHEELDEKVLRNSSARCYFCKKSEYGEIRAWAAEQGISVVLDGMNADDRSDYRPGALAAQELEVRHLLQEAGLSKADVRALARKLGVPLWNKPANACLASRIPQDERITGNKLARVEAAEEFLEGLGFEHLRVRSHEDLARIEVQSSEIARFYDMDFMENINIYLKKLGFAHVTLDLGGYSRGSVNSQAKRQPANQAGQPEARHPENEQKTESEMPANGRLAVEIT